MPVQDSLTFTSAPYYDDFDERNDFYRILFRPSYAVQARELTQSQTILQDQITKLANVVYTDGDLVAGGGLTVDTTIASVKLENQFDSVDIVVTQFQNTVIEGASDTTGTARAYVVGVVARDAEDYNTLIVRYFTDKKFGDGVTVSTDDDSVQATTVSATGPSKIPNASNVASMVSVQESVYYMSGFLNYVPSQYLVLEKYSNEPSYSVGFYIDEIIVDENDANASPVLSGTDIGETLLDPANGAYNFNAPGATRYRQKLVLAKKSYIDSNVFQADANTKFMELFRVTNGAVSSSFNSIAPNDIFRDEREEFRGQINPLSLTISPSIGVKGTTNSSQQAVITGQETVFEKDFMVGDVVYLSNQEYVGNGVVSTNGSATVTGENTTFTTDFVSGQNIVINEKNYEVGAIINATSLSVIGQTEKYQTNVPYTVGALTKAQVVDIASNTQMTVNTLLGDGTTQNIINANTVSVHMEPGLMQYGNSLIYHTRTQTESVRKPRKIQYVDNVTVGKDVTNYFLVTGEQLQQVNGTIRGPGAIDVTNIDEVLYLHSTISPNVASNTQLHSTVIATARIRDFVPINVKNVDQGLNEYGLSLWNIKPKTLANTLGFIANNSFLTLNGPTAALEDAYNGVTIEFQSGKLAGHRTKITKYYQNTSCDVEELPNTPIAGDEYRFIYQSKDVKAIGVHSGLGLSALYKVSANNGVDADGGSFLFAQSQDPSLLYELPYEVATLKDSTGITRTSYTSRRMRQTDIVPGAGTAGSFSLQIDTDMTFAENDTQTALGLDANRSRELFQIFGATSSDTAVTPVGNTLSLSGNTDIVILEGGDNNSTKATQLRVTIGDVGAAGDVSVYYEGEIQNVPMKSKNVQESQKVIVTSPNKTLGGIDSVQQVDVFRIRAVIDSQTNADGTIAPLSAGDLEVASTGGTLTGANTVYVTQNYEIYTGQEDNAYLHGGVRLIGDPPRGQIGIVFDHFIHGDLNSGKYFCIDSYPATMPREDIPSYTTSGGKVIKLCNAIDFRPAIQNLNIDSGYQNTSSDASQTVDNTDSIWLTDPKVLPSFSNGISVSLGYYTNKVDTVVVDTERDIELLEGQESGLPYAPNLRKEHLEITDILTAPWVYDTSDVQFKPAIAEENQFYDLMVNFGENNSKHTPVGKETVFQTFDNFEGHSKADVESIDFSASIDSYEGLLKPAVTTTNWQLEYQSIASANVENYKSLVMTEGIANTKAFTNPFYTSREAINPFGRSQFRGKLTLFPQFNNWLDQNILPRVAFNVVGENDGFTKSVVPYQNIFFNIHEIYWYGIHSTRDVMPKRTTRQYERFVSEVNYPKLPLQFYEQITPNIKRDMSVVPFIPAQTIYFNAEGMLGSANLFMYFDNERIDTRFVRFAKRIVFEDAEISSAFYQTGEFVKQTVGLETARGIVVAIMKPTPERTMIHVVQTSAQDFDSTSVGTVDGETSTARGNIFTIEVAPTSLSADQYGMVSGAFDLPAGRFTAGDRLLRITNAEDSNTAMIETSFAEQVFYGKPIDPDAQTTRPNIIKRSDNDDSFVYHSEYDRIKYSTKFLREFAQEIYVDPSAYPEGLFITGGILYVANNDSEANTGAPIKMAIKTMVDGFPSPSETLPFSELIIQATEVKETATPDAANTETQTRFNYSDPVFLAPGKSYAMTFDSDNPEYKLHTAVVGESLTNEDHRVPRFKYFPGLWRTNNHGNWNRDDKTMICMDIYRQRFYQTHNSCAFFNVKDFPTSNVSYNQFYVRAPHMTFGNVSQPIFSYRSQKTTGFDLNYSSFLPNQTYDFAVFGRTGEQRVIGTDANTLTINVAMYAGDDRVAPVIDKDQMQLITIENIINNAELSADSFIIENPGFGYDFDTTLTGNTAATIVISGGAVHANGDEIGEASLVMGEGGRVVQVNLDNPGYGYTGNVTATVVNKVGSTAPTTEAVIRVKSETDPYAGNAKSRYISKIFNMGGVTAKGIKVIGEGVRPGGTDILVYARATSGFGSRKIKDEYYQMLPGTMNKHIYGDNVTVYGWQTPDDFLLRDENQITYDSFGTFQLKVVFTSTDSTTVPYLKNLRIFAYV